jgi:hypothetical protein
MLLFSFYHYIVLAYFCTFFTSVDKIECDRSSASVYPEPVFVNV